MFRFAIPLLTLAIIAGPVAAQETRATATAKFRAEFAASDTNKDGLLTQAEVQARIQRMRAGKTKTDPVHAKRLAGLWFSNADANKDGKVTEAEGQALLVATMDRYDANRDGKVGTGEKAQAKKAILGR
ncbi:hypothetical protein ASE75_09205 [Sphingomonas sp. Leaf17]|uniref:EF-hand domain-containing protein n=1 Tax=Sphingomonas sp. Leaf17 TaxID=1735683 RepID=UPI0006F1D7F5|nr:EF-hand domain-containing protein [Sphingomonas sp. Leaf17]KQM64172.1 hypothetical protein ASE75_09205 [Sphingomonas sp. Leaf17]